LQGIVYKLGEDGILRCCVLEHERLMILEEPHDGIAGGNYAMRATAQKIMCGDLVAYTLQIFYVHEVA
jgi:hypothetical protein